MDFRLVNEKLVAMRAVLNEDGPVAGDPDSFTKEQFDAAVKRYVAELQKVVHAFWKSNPSAHTVGMDNGPKYIRLWQGDDKGKSALGFIDKTTGFLLKADGWKKPAKGPRGDVFKDSPKGGNGAIG